MTAHRVVGARHDGESLARGQHTASWLEHHAARTPDNVALVDVQTGRETSYAQLAGRVRALAYALAEDLGAQPGDRVAVLARNDARVFEVMYACALLGAVFIPLNWRLTPAELMAISSDAEPSVLVHESWAQGVAAQVAAETNGPLLVGWASETGDPDGYERLAVAESWSRTA